MTKMEPARRTHWWKFSGMDLGDPEANEFLSKIQKLLNKNLLQDVIDFFVEEASKILKIEIYNLYFLDEQILHLHTSKFPDHLKGLDHLKISMNLQNQDHFLFKECLTSNKILNLKDDKIFQYDNYNRLRFEYWGIKNSVLFPLNDNQGNPPIGLFQISSNLDMIEPDKILEIKELIQFFYQPFLRALNHHQLQKKAQSAENANSKYQLLFKLASNINRLSEPQKVYQTLIDSLLSVFDFEMGFIMLEEEGRLVTTEGSGINSETTAIFKKLLAHFGEFTNAPKIKAPGGAEMACCTVFLNNTPLFFEDISVLKDLPMKDKDRIGIELTGKAIKSVLQVPIRSGDLPIGVLQLWSFSKISTCSETDMEMIVQLCSFIPSIINNSSLHVQLACQKSELEEKNTLIQYRNTQFMEDLKLAQKIQLNLIPRKLPNFKNLAFSAFYQPMDQVGGDFYDFLYESDEKWVGIFISDVSGHGMPAALITSMLKTLIGTGEKYWKNPNLFLKYINNKINGLTNGNFMTIFYGIYDIDNKILTYCRGSHPYPIISRGKELIELKGEGRIIGIFEQVEFEQIQVQLYSGDKLFFFTDGLVETFNHQHERFKKRFHELIQFSSRNTIRQTLQIISSDLLDFAHKQVFKDDICLLGMEIF